MGSVCVGHAGDIPSDFVQKFWIAPGTDFYQFLARLVENDLLFTIEVPADASDGPSVLQQIDDELGTRRATGGPTLPKSSRTFGPEPSHSWQLLSCKQTKVKPKDLRAGNIRQGKEKQEFIEIKATSEMLAPVDYKVATVTKRFGFKNPLRSEEGDPEMLVVIGEHTGWLVGAVTQYQSSGARFPGYCTASIGSVFHDDFEEGHDDILYKHGCYPYRLLHGLTICGQNTEDTFAPLLRRCSSGRNGPMCHCDPDALVSDDEVSLFLYGCWCLLTIAHRT